jgi:hypothetical protein
MKGFSPTWCEWISKVMTRGSVAIKVNDNIGYFFSNQESSAARGSVISDSV